MSYASKLTSDELFSFFNLEYDAMDAYEKSEEEQKDEKNNTVNPEKQNTETKSTQNEIKQNDFTNAVEEALLQTEQNDIKESKHGKPRILQDFGKKIGGARKDAFAAYRDLLLDANAQEIDSSYTLRNNWPEPKYEKLLKAGVEPWKVAALRALREANTSKVKKHMLESYYYFDNNIDKAVWRARLLETRNLASAILKGELSRDDFIKYLADINRGKFVIEEAYHPVRLPKSTGEIGSEMRLPDTVEVLHIDTDWFRSDFRDYPKGFTSAYIPALENVNIHDANARGFAYYDYTHIYHVFRLYETLGHKYPLSNYRIKEEPIPLRQKGDSFFEPHALLTMDGLNHQYTLFESTSQKNAKVIYEDWDHIQKSYYGQIGVYNTFEDMVSALKAHILAKKPDKTKENTGKEQNEETLFEKNKGNAYDYVLYWDNREHTKVRILRKVGKIPVVIRHLTIDDCKGDGFEGSSLLRRFFIYKNSHIDEIQKKFSELVGPNLDTIKKYFVMQSRTSGEYKFYRKVPGANVLMYSSSFSDDESAMNFFLKQVQDFETAYKDGRRVPFERNKDNMARTGKGHEHGDITPEDYTKTFGFRGVEFGNWLTGKDRQNRLNDSYDALLDLADVMGVEPQALSLGGALSMRFGSNGRGGKNAAMAHFEHGYNAINLTKENGAGCLAHEWFHALDYHLGHKAEMEMLSDRFYFKAQGGSLSADTKDAFSKLQNLLYCETKIKERSASLDAHTSHSSKPYWSQDREMLARTFEAYVNSKLADKGIHNDFLVNIKSEKTWDAETKDRKASYLNKAYPYPLESEMPVVKEKFDAFINAMSTKKVNGKVEFFSCSNHETLGEMTEQCKAVSRNNLNVVQQTWQDFGQQELGLNVLFYDGPQELHGKYDAANNMLYLNRDSELDFRWTFYHEAFHALKNRDPELYKDLLEATESTNLITKNQIETYRQSIHAKELSDDQIKEEMLADAFADQKSDIKAILHFTSTTPVIANHLMTSVRRLANRAKAFFGKQNKKVGLTAEQAAAFKDRLDYIAQNLTINGIKPLADIHNVLGHDGYPMILRKDSINHIPTVYPHNQDKQMTLDINAAKELCKVYPANIVRETIQQFSPQKTANRSAYAEHIMRSAMKAKTR